MSWRYLSLYSLIFQDIFFNKKDIFELQYNQNKEFECLFNIVLSILYSDFVIVKVMPFIAIGCTWLVLGMTRNSFPLLEIQWMLHLPLSE